MSASQEYDVPIIDSILHLSVCSAASEVAFAHALKAALIAKSQLTVMRVSPSSRDLHHAVRRRTWRRPRVQMPRSRRGPWRGGRRSAVSRDVGGYPVDILSATSRQHW
jgi:hypothetical protein